MCQASFRKFFQVGMNCITNFDLQILPRVPVSQNFLCTCFPLNSTYLLQILPSPLLEQVTFLHSRSPFPKLQRPWAKNSFLQLIGVFIISFLSIDRSSLNPNMMHQDIKIPHFCKIITKNFFRSSSLNHRPKPSHIQISFPPTLSVEI